ncbi:MAG TPA: sigma-70 family RNA polymerase sigma factor [Gaiellaceae bacterium]|jgi:RNA polymerase sigma-70 factor (ECF subfamily)
MGTQGTRASRADLEQLYRNHLPELLRVAAAICRDREAAPDVVHDGFVRALRELASFRGTGPLAGWLWRIVVNTARNHRRDNPAHEPLPFEPVANGNGSSEEGRVAAAVSLLPERQRLVLFLRFYADLDYASIGEALGITTGTVGATLAAARAALEQHLSEKEATG